MSQIKKSTLGRQGWGLDGDCYRLLKGLAKCCYRLSLDRREAKRGWMRRERQKREPKETDSAEEGTLFRDGFTLGSMVYLLFV